VMLKHFDMFAPRYIQKTNSMALCKIQRSRFRWMWKTRGLNPFVRKHFCGKQPNENRGWQVGCGVLTAVCSVLRYLDLI
jgi:hypothetical protein